METIKYSKVGLNCKTEEMELLDSENNVIKRYDVFLLFDKMMKESKIEFEENKDYVLKEDKEEEEK